jgi:hypothetical protein
VGWMVLLARSDGAKDVEILVLARAGRIGHGRPRTQSGISPRIPDSAPGRASPGYCTAAGCGPVAKALSRCGSALIGRWPPPCRRRSTCSPRHEERARRRSGLVANQRRWPDPEPVIWPVCREPTSAAPPAGGWPLPACSHRIREPRCPVLADHGAARPAILTVDERTEHGIRIRTGLATDSRSHPIPAGPSERCSANRPQIRRIDGYCGHRRRSARRARARSGVTGRNARCHTGAKTRS